MKRLIGIAMVALFVIMIMAATINAAETARDLCYSNKTDPAREGEYSEITKLLGSKWELNTRDVFCGGDTDNILSCNDRLEFVIKAEDFNQNELEKALTLWKKYGREKELYALEHPEYKLRSIAILFGFPREKGVPDDIVVIFYYNGESDSNYKMVDIYNDNSEWQYKSERFLAFDPCPPVVLGNRTVDTDSFCQTEEDREIYSFMKKVDTPK